GVERRGVAVRAAGDHGEAGGWRPSAVDPPALARLFEEGADACGTEEEAPERGGEYHAEHRLAVFDQRDVDGEFAVAVNELTRTVERVDEPEAPPRRCLEAAGGRFLGDDR